MGVQYENQDLEAHQYSGKGRAAKHKSQIAHVNRDYSKIEEEQGFQEALVQKLQKDYQNKIDDLTSEKQRVNEDLDARKNRLGDVYTSNEQILHEFEHLLQNEAKYKNAAKEAESRIQELQDEQERLEQEVAAQSELLNEERNKLEKAQEKYASEEQDFIDVMNSFAEASNNEEGIFSNAKKWYYGKKKNSAKQSLETYLQQKEDKQASVAAMEARLQQISEQKADVAIQLAAAKEEKEDSQVYANVYGQLVFQYSDMYAERFAVSPDDGTEAANKEKEQKLDYLEAYKDKAQFEIYQTQIEENEKKKQSVKDQVIQAEILDMAKKGSASTARAIIVDGEMYYDNKQLSGVVTPQSRVRHSSEVTNLVEQSEEMTLLEEEKIITQLKKRDVFQYINSDNLMEYMDYDEHQADFIFAFQKAQENNARQTAKDENASKLSEFDMNDMIAKGLTDDIAFEKYIDSLTSSGFWNGTWNTIKFLAAAGWNAGLGFIGVDDLIKTIAASKDGNDREKILHEIGSAANFTKLITMLLNLESLGIFGKLKNAGLAGTLQNIGTTNILGLDLLGKTNVSLLSGAGTLVKLANGLTGTIHATKDEHRLTDYGDKVKKRGLNRFGRVMDGAAAEKRIQALEGYTDMGSAALTSVLNATGIGGLLFTGINVALSVAIKKIGAHLIRSGSIEQIVNSPSVLGGINYDHNLIDEDHFNMLFHHITGINDPGSLGTALKVVDGIDLHRAMRKSILKPNLEVDSAMSQLGFTNPGKYADISLKTIHQRIGVTDNDWRKELRNAIEIKGIDYNTSWTKFVKGVTGNYKHYEKNRIASRKAAAAKRREELLSKNKT